MQFVSYIKGDLPCEFIRKMRNRDSAMKSRERKKTYIKDLETKSKYLEAECRRLSYALQCYAAENMALRQSLLKDRLVGAPTAMQESAVLTGKIRPHIYITSPQCIILVCRMPEHFSSFSNALRMEYELCIILYASLVFSSPWNKSFYCKHLFTL